MKLDLRRILQARPDAAGPAGCDPANDPPNRVLQPLRPPTRVGLPDPDESVDSSTGSGSGGAGSSGGLTGSVVGETRDADARFERRLAAVGPLVAAGISIGHEWSGVVDRDDIMQVTYIEAYLAHREGRLDPSSLRAWLRRAAENNLRDAIATLRCAKRPPPDRRLRPGPGEDPVLWLHRQATSGGTTPSRGCAREELAELIRLEVLRLPPLYREVIELVVLRGMSHSEAAAMIGRSRGAVSLLQQRAIEAVRRGMKP